MTPDNELIRQYAQARSEEAFAELVRRHVNLVYSAALRQVGGDAHLAQDVAQTVFTDLARKAASVSRRDTLTGWLYTSTHFAAAKAVRGESRRRDREERFMREPIHEPAPNADWEILRPILDEAMHGLGETDREAVLLRYFENRAFAEVGAKLNLNENAARMRVDRALEKLRLLLAKRGFTTGAALASVISANAIQTAPVLSAASLASASLAGAGTGAFAFLKMMSATQWKLGAGALIVAGAITAFVIQHRAQESLRAQDESLAGQLAVLQAENANLSKQLSAAANSQLSSEQQAELLKLRAEVTRLRAIKNQSAAVPALATNDAPAVKKTQITLNVRFVSVPAGEMQTFGFGWAPAGNEASLLSDEQLERAAKKWLEDGDIHLIGSSQITTLSGREARASVIQSVPVDGGTNAEVGEIVDVVPYFSADSSIFTLNLLAELRQLIGDPSRPGVQTLQTSNHVNLFPGQTTVLERDLPPGGWLPDSAKLPDAPAKLLVFVTPTLIDEAGNRVSPPTAVSREAAMQKMDQAKQGVLALIMFASDNQMQFPTAPAQASRYVKDDLMGQIATNFDMLCPASITNIPNPANTIVLKEKQAWETPEGKWMKTYGFADGHSEIHSEPTSNFDEFEKSRILPSPSTQ
jgi:RNA polymerase sigma factor (sigma-70 family)